MTIAQAFNDIAVAQGGTASKSGTIAGAIDALNDALAGSDQDAASTIEDAVRLLGAHISQGGGGGGASIGDPVKIIYVYSDSKGGDTILWGSYDYIEAMYLGDDELVGVAKYNYMKFGEVASGIKVKSYQVSTVGSNDDAVIYLVTPKQVEDYEVIDTITPLETDVHTYIDDGNKYFTLTIPEIAQGAYLGILWTVGD